MIKKTAPHSTVYLRRDEKLYLKGWFTATRFVAKIYLQSNLVEHKRSGRIFDFGHPFRQRNGTCKLAATEDYRVFHKIIFRGCPIIHSLYKGVVGELSINLIKLRWLVASPQTSFGVRSSRIHFCGEDRWLATGLFCLGSICFSGLIYSDRT